MKKCVYASIFEKEKYGKVHIYCMYKDKLFSLLIEKELNTKICSKCHNFKEEESDGRKV